MVASRDLSFLWGITSIKGHLLFYIVRSEISAKMFSRDKRRCSNEQWIEARQSRHGVRREGT